MKAASDQDISQQLRDRVVQAADQGQRLAITGQGSKSFYGHPASGEALITAGHTGVTDYEPGDLVITARSGTPIVEIDQLLAEQGQYLGFEPPRFASNNPAIDGFGGTLGGAIATGLSGPRRPWVGAVRDFVLGVTMVNGLGHRLHFGGQLIKNVAGFDLPRLMAGSMGTLGLLLDISVRVLPRRPAEITLQLELSAADALAKMVAWQRQPLPLSGLVYHQGRLSVRLSGTVEGVDAARATIGGEPLADAPDWWAGLRDQRWSWFGRSQSQALWRISCAAAAELPAIDGEWLIDWGGAQRWYRGSATAAALQTYAQQVDGQLTCFKGGDRSRPLVASNSPLASIHQQLKLAFDPNGVFDGDRLLVEAPGLAPHSLTGPGS